MNNTKPYNETKATSTTHGLGVLKRAVKELGARALDGRTTLAKELQAEQEELTQALGGESEVSPQERAIIQMIAQKRIRRRIAAQWALLNPDKLFDRRKRSFAPLALQLEQLEESEARLLEKLGLKRRAKQLPSLAEYLNGDGKRTKETKLTKEAVASHAEDRTQHSQDVTGEA